MSAAQKRISAGVLIGERAKAKAAKAKVTVVPTPSTEMTTDEAARALIAQQRNRRFAIVSQSRCDRSVDSFLAAELGFDPEAEDATRKAVFKAAGAARRAIEKDKYDLLPPALKAATGVIPLVKNSALARSTWDEHRKSVEADMRELAKHLPIYEFAEGVRGLGALGIGIIIGETGSLTRRTSLEDRNYPSPAAVWKRLGLAVIHGERQQRKTDKQLAEDHGFAPKRRAEVWALLSDSLFRAQWCGEDRATREALMTDPKAAAYITAEGIDLAKLKGEPLKALAEKLDNQAAIAAAGYPVGPYGEIYQRRRKHMADQVMTPKHRHMDACRIMSKAVICDLWRVWNGQPARYAKIVDDRPHLRAA